MATETLENRAYMDVKKRIHAGPSEKSYKEMSFIRWRINSYAKLGGINDIQKTELLNMLFDRAIGHGAIKANEELFEKKRIMKAFKSSQPYYSTN